MASGTDIVKSGRDQPKSTLLQQAPVLTSRGLTILLAAMCIIPVATVTALHLSMPPVKVGYLSAEVGLINVPPASYYDIPWRERVSKFPEAAIVIKNTGEEAWTHLNVRINGGHYQIYEHGSPFQPNEERAFLLKRFVHRSGAEFDVAINHPDSVEIYARLPSKIRGTFESKLD